MSAPRPQKILAAFLGVVGVAASAVHAQRGVPTDATPPAAAQRQLWIVNQQDPNRPTDLPPYEIKLLEPLPDPTLPVTPPVATTIQPLPTPQASVAAPPEHIQPPASNVTTTVPMTAPPHAASEPSTLAAGDIRSPDDYLSRIDRILTKMREGTNRPDSPVAQGQPPSPRREPAAPPRYVATAPTVATPTTPSAPVPPVASRTINGSGFATGQTVAGPPERPIAATPPPVALAPEVVAVEPRAQQPEETPSTQPAKKRTGLLSLLALPGLRQLDSPTTEQSVSTPGASSAASANLAEVARLSQPVGRSRVVQATATEPLPPIELSLPERAKVAVTQLPRKQPPVTQPTMNQPEAMPLQTSSPSRPASAAVDPLAVREAAAKLTQPQSLIQSTLSLARRAAPPVEPTPQTVQTALAEEPIDGSTELPPTTPYPQRPKIYFRPAVPQVNRQGHPILRPEVRVAGRQPAPPTPPTPEVKGLAEEIPLDGAEAIPGAIETPIIPDSWSAPFVAESGVPCGPGGPPPRLGPCQELLCRVRARLNGPCSVEPGIGTERVMHAISFVDTSQPQNNFRLRFDAAYDYQTPDRAEYFWAKIGTPRGPTAPPNLGETDLDYQEVEAFMELGGDKFSVGTSIPILIIDPENYANTSGLGDITITTKTVFLDGARWQLTNLFRTYIPSADSKAGLGTGHASIEPGFAWRYKWSDITYLHGDLKYWVPLGGDPVHSGEVLNYGFAISHVWRDSDDFAVMPTLELVAYSFLDGQFTAPGSTATVEVDPQGILTIHPGVRWVWDKGCDCGVREFGIFGGIAATSDSVYEEIIRAEMRWVW